MSAVYATVELCSATLYELRTRSDICYIVNFFAVLLVLLSRALYSANFASVFIFEFLMV